VECFFEASRMTTLSRKGADPNNGATPSTRAGCACFVDLSGANDATVLRLRIILFGVPRVAEAATPGWRA
jgi:hypothetical protein